MTWSGRDAMSSEIWSTVLQLPHLSSGQDYVEANAHSIMKGLWITGLGEESRVKSLKVNGAWGQNGRLAEWEWSYKSEQCWVDMGKVPAGKKRQNGCLLLPSCYVIEAGWISNWKMKLSSRKRFHISVLPIISPKRSQVLISWLSTWRSI